MTAPHDPPESIDVAVERVHQEFPWAPEALLEAHVGLAQTHAQLRELLTARYAEMGLNVPRANVLRLLHYATDQRLTMGDLGGLLGVTPANVTKLVDGLERTGWVTRLPHSTDRRVTWVALSSEGSSRLAGMLPQVVAIWCDLWGGLTPEEHQTLTELLNKLRASLQGDQPRRARNRNLPAPANAAP